MQPVMAIATKDSNNVIENVFNTHLLPNASQLSLSKSILNSLLNIFTVTKPPVVTIPHKEKSINNQSRIGTKYHSKSKR